MSEWPKFARGGLEAAHGFARAREPFVYLGDALTNPVGRVLSAWLDAISGKEMKLVRHSGGGSGRGSTICSVSYASVPDSLTAPAFILAEGSKRPRDPKDGWTWIDVPPAGSGMDNLPFRMMATFGVLNVGLGLGRDADALESLREVERLGKGPVAEDVGRKFSVSIPVVYTDGLTVGVAEQFRMSVAGGANAHALVESFPDAFHNDIESWGDPSDRFLAVFLRTSYETERDREKTDRMAKMLRESGREVVELGGVGESLLSQLVTLSYRLDSIAASVSAFRAAGHDDAS